jgi:fructose-1,6-bisphosphatase/sedoheptulose 1,7-bisphosphatase-like protein
MVGQETKRKIIELYFTQHKNIREIAKEVQKSSRNVVIVVKEHKQKLKQSSQAGINARDDVDQQKEVDFIRSPINVRANELFTKGLTPPQVASELKLSEEDTTSYYTEYRLRLPFKATAGSRKN